ncbi:MAG: diguanylate cyclase [Clostridiales bacterium]|nr:diguanylate cyclase [Clostridiales bacterium]
MRSLREKISFLTTGLVILAVLLVSFASAHFIRKNEQRKSDQLLLLLCETGERNLEYYFNSVQKSVVKVSAFAEADMEGLDDEKLAGHVERVGDYFDEIASKTNGVLTYYYRIDPDVSKKVKGFWYTDLDGSGFVPHEVTDITKYDTQDTSKLVWFTVPKYNGEAIWLPPYITDNLDVRVISYNVPVYLRGQFVGVIGIEIDYSTMAEQVDSIRLYSNGYAFLSDSEGNLFYHPRIDVSNLNEETKPDLPDGAVDESTFLRYSFQGEEKEAVWLPLSNGMRLNVCAPLSETEGDWQKLMLDILILAAVILAATIFISLMVVKRIVKPLEQLNEAAEQAYMGNFEYFLDYDKDDEVGRLTKTFKLMASHMRDSIRNLNKQVYVDALTHVKNKGAFVSYETDLQNKIDNGEDNIEFAIGVFDCDDLKYINDHYGHEKGDAYLKVASHTICGVFQHSPVFRIGGDEFAVILRNEDYENRDLLVNQLEKAVMRINSSSSDQWEQVQISYGIAVYDPRHDKAVSDVVRNADRIMYEHKRQRKKLRR